MIKCEIVMTVCGKMPFLMVHAHCCDDEDADNKNWHLSEWCTPFIPALRTQWQVDSGCSGSQSHTCKHTQAKQNQTDSIHQALIGCWILSKVLPESTGAVVVMCFRRLMLYLGFEVIPNYLVIIIGMVKVSFEVIPECYNNQELKIEWCRGLAITLFL